MFIKRSLKRVDVFGSKVELFMKKESTFKTAFGGLLTSLLIGCFMSLVIPRFKDLVTKAQTNSIEKIRYSPSEGEFLLSPGKFMIAFGFSNPSLNPYVNFSLVARSNIRNATSGAITKHKITVPTEPCTPAHFNDLEKEYRTINLTGFLCPKLDGNLSWPVKGTYTDNIFNFLQIKISECKNSSKCPDRDKFFSQNPQLDFNIFFTSHDNNPGDFDRPLQKRISSELHFLLDNRPVNVLYKEADVFLRSLQVKFDREVFFPASDYAYYEGIMFGNEIKEQVSMSTNNGELANFFIRKSAYIVGGSSINILLF
jgi:hypothetical protein